MDSHKRKDNFGGYIHYKVQEGGDHILIVLYSAQLMVGTQYLLNLDHLN